MSLEVNHEALQGIADSMAREMAGKAQAASAGRAVLGPSGMALSVGVEGMNEEYGTSMLPARPWVIKMLEELDGGS